MIREYREKKGITQEELVREMRPYFPWVDASLISKMESGKCSPTSAMREWLEKGLASPTESLKDGKGTTTQYESLTAETGDFSPVMARVYEALKETDINHRISRRELSRITGIGDRASRDLLEEMRSMGYRIGSEMGAEGYWLIRSEEEYRAWIKVYSSRAYTVLKNKSAMDNYVEGQIRI